MMDNKSRQDTVLIEKDQARDAFLNKPLGSLILKNTLPAVASMLFMAF